MVLKKEKKEAYLAGVNLFMAIAEATYIHITVSSPQLMFQFAQPQAHSPESCLDGSGLQSLHGAWQSQSRAVN